MKKLQLRKAKELCAFLAVLGMSITFVVRAAISGITYDEAFTYLAYARPLMDLPTIGMVESIFWGCVANNHWLNTFLISIVCGISGIQYSEFLIRLPAIIFGCTYLCVNLICYKRRKIDGYQFVLLSFCYYLQEFFGLARGYGMATALVLWGILIFEEWLNEKCCKHWLLILSIGMFIASAYANSVTLVVCFCIGIMMLYRLISSKQLLPFLKKCWPVLIVYAGASLVIVKFHFRVSGEGMPLWAADQSSVLGLMAEYVSMLLKGDTIIKIVSVILLILVFASVVVLALCRKIMQCDLGIAYIVYFICLIMMDTVFGRGGFYGRTLLPAYPLVVLGIYQLFLESKKVLSERYSIKMEKACCIVGTIVVLVIGVMYCEKVDLLRTRDWHNDYNVKTDSFFNPEFESNTEHASVVFYEEKKIWDMENLLQDYSDMEENNYELK